MTEFTYDADIAHAGHNACKHKTKEEMKTLVDNAIAIIEPVLKNQFEQFKIEGICGEDLLVYLINVVCITSSFYVFNATKVYPQDGFQMCVLNLIKGISIYHGIQIVDERTEMPSASTH